ncbi:photosystem reaction center subunit H [Methylobacterium oryzihabitans]|uniref:photosystem reaction center subunit H n=1 Tax=Methylobacterium oryzihabitans TaxID=2499852 RepID=UPI001FECAD0D|nr:photosystem reaction center subunit H [Methylobacterium oryzihabitans]
MRALASLGVCLVLATVASAQTRSVPDAAGTAKPVAATAEPGKGCDVVGLRLEDEIARKPELRESANAQTVRDLRTLRDAAIILDAHKRPAECARLVAILRELVADPDRTIEQGGDTDEEKAETIEEAREPKAPAPKR